MSHAHTHTHTHTHTQNEPCTMHTKKMNRVAWKWDVSLQNEQCSIYQRIYIAQPCTKYTSVESEHVTTKWAIQYISTDTYIVCSAAMHYIYASVESGHVTTKWDTSPQNEPISIYQQIHI